MINAILRTAGLLEPHEVLKVEHWIDNLPVPVKRDERILDIPVCEFFTDERIGSSGVQVRFYGRNIRSMMTRLEKKDGRTLFLKDLYRMNFADLKKVKMVGDKTIDALKTVLHYYRP
jgi:hypothetical protein